MFRESRKDNNFLRYDSIIEFNAILLLSIF